MRFQTAAAGMLFCFVSLVWMCDPASAQQWSVDLYDVNLEDRDGIIDRTRAESLEFMPDGKTLVTAGYFYNSAVKATHGEVRLRNVADGSLKATLRGTTVTYTLRAGSLAVSPDGKRIAAAGRTSENANVIDLFDPAGKKLVRTLKGSPGTITSVAFSPDGKVLAAAHTSGIVELWNPHNGKLISSFRAHDEGVWPLTFSPDGKLLATGNDGGSISFWNPKNSKKLGQIAAQPELGSFGAVVFSPDGKLLASGGFPNRQGNSPVCVWKLVGVNQADKQITAELTAKFKGHRKHTYSLAFSPDGKLLASASQDTTARVWDVVTNKQIATITEHNDFVYDVAFSPDGKSLATLSRDSLKLWTMEQIKRRK